MSAISLDALKPFIEAFAEHELRKITVCQYEPSVRSDGSKPEGERNEAIINHQIDVTPALYGGRIDEALLSEVILEQKWTTDLETTELGILSAAMVRKDGAFTVMHAPMIDFETGVNMVRIGWNDLKYALSTRRMRPSYHGYGKSALTPGQYFKWLAQFVHFDRRVIDLDWLSHVMETGFGILRISSNVKPEIMDHPPAPPSGPAKPSPF